MTAVAVSAGAARRPRQTGDDQDQDQKSTRSHRANLRARRSPRSPVDAVAWALGVAREARRLRCVLAVLRHAALSLSPPAALAASEPSGKPADKHRPKIWFGLRLPAGAATR